MKFSLSHFDRKELKGRKQLEEFNSLSNCSLSSASNSSSGSQSISFLEEIKSMGDHKRLLRPINSADNSNNNLINNKLIANKTNETNGKTNMGSNLVTPLNNCDKKNEKIGIKKCLKCLLIEPHSQLCANIFV